MKPLSISLALAALLAAEVARADCGSIPFKPQVNIFEPKQRAVIAFDGKSEILLLSTDLSASEPTKVLEVIPFPSEPKVAKGDERVFYAATGLIYQKLEFSPYSARRKAIGGIMGMGGAGGGKTPPPAGQVVVHKKIGPHDISVIRVLDARRFTGWVDDYLKKAGVDNPQIPPALRLVVQEYLEDGFTWFAFDVVELGTETAIRDAVQYRFDTRAVYYPLRITRSETGATTIWLVMVTPRLLRIPILHAGRVRLMHRPVQVSGDELRYLDKDIYELLGKQSPMLLRIWEIKGRLSGFKEDIVTTWY